MTAKRKDGASFGAPFRASFGAPFRASLCAALVEPAVPKHCDDYIDDADAPTALRVYLDRARAPAHGLTDTAPFPKLYADHQGTRVRVVMASRLGDVGITRKLDADLGYEQRVTVEDLTNFGDAP